MNRVQHILCLILASSAALGQSKNEALITASEGTNHLLTHSDAIYPPIARAAHVQGTVLLQVSVDPKGNVTDVQATGGPEMLRGEAIATVRHWTYRPFEVDGKPSAVNVIVTMPFSLPDPAIDKSDMAIGETFFPKSDKCRSQNASRKWSEAVKPCGEAVTIAERFPDPRLRADAIRGAYVAYGEALAHSGNAAEALHAFQKATALAETLTPTDGEYALAYYWQAFAEHSLGMPGEAARDYSTAESSFRKAIVSLPNMKNVYSRQLAHTLALHSVLAHQTGKDAEASTMRKEALELDRHSMDGMGVNN